MASDTSPLLPDPRLDTTPQTADTTSSHAHAKKLDGRAARLRQHWARWSVLYLCGLFIIVIDIPSFMADAPRLRMIEQGLCLEHYRAADPGLIRPDGTIPERLCKLRQIQSALAKMKGFLGMFETLPGLVLAVPYGILADLRGRRLVMVLVLVGNLLKEAWLYMVLHFSGVFPIRAVYAGPLFILIGGGPTVISPMIMATIAAGTPMDSRTQAFFWVFVVLLITEMVSPPLSSSLMQKLGFDLAYFITLPLSSIGLAVLFLIREPRQERNVREEVDVHAGAVEGQTAPTLGARTSKAVAKLVQYLREDMRPILGRNNVIIGLIALMFGNMASPPTGLVLQYLSARFGWRLSEANYLLSIIAAVKIVVLVAVLPNLNRWLLLRCGPSRADLALAKISVLFLALGALSMGLSVTAPIFIVSKVLHTLGSGNGAALRSLMTRMVSQDHLSLLFTSLSVFEGLAALCASPLFGLSFSAGLDIGGPFVGIPFLIAAGLYGISGVLVVMNRFEAKKSTEV